MPASATDPDGVLAEIRALYGADRPDKVLARAKTLWAAYGDVADARLGECWRFAMISASRNAEMRGAAAMWRARARSAFARSGCHNGLALTMLADFFQAAALFEDEPTVAFAILDAMLATVGGPEDPVASDLVRDIYFEKRGFLRAKLGTARNDRTFLAQARDDYNRALEFAHIDPRRRLKIRAGRSSVDYLLAESDDARVAAIAELTKIGEEAERAHQIAVDVVRIVQLNLEHMRARSRDLEPYETV